MTYEFYQKSYYKQKGKVWGQYLGGFNLCGSRVSGSVGSSGTGVRDKVGGGMSFMCPISRVTSVVI